MSGRGPSPQHRDTERESVLASTPLHLRPYSSRLVSARESRERVLSRLSAVCRQLSPTRKHIHEHIYIMMRHMTTPVARSNHDHHLWSQLTGETGSASNRLRRAHARTRPQKQWIKSSRRLARRQSRHHILVHRRLQGGTQVGQLVLLACKGVLKPVGILRRPIPRGRALELRGWRRHDWQLQLLRSSWHLRSWHLRSWHLCSWHLRSRTWR